MFTRPSDLSTHLGEFEVIFFKQKIVEHFLPNLTLNAFIHAKIQLQLFQQHNSKLKITNLQPFIKILKFHQNLLYTSTYKITNILKEIDNITTQVVFDSVAIHNPCLFYGQILQYHSSMWHNFIDDEWSRSLRFQLTEKQSQSRIK